MLICNKILKETMKLYVFLIFLENYSSNVNGEKKEATQKETLCLMTAWRLT